MTDALSNPQPKKSVLEIATYVPGKSSVPAGVKLHKLSSNESPLGPSPDVRAVLEGDTARFQDYPDGSATLLRQAISEVHGLNPENIICGNGSDEILSMLATAYLSPGDEAIFTEHGFLVYRIAILAAGANPVSVAEDNCVADVDAILAAVTPATKMVFLANPNNPTGTYLPIEEIRRLHAGLPSHVVLVIDAAYAEYVGRNDYEAGIEMVSDSSNVVMTRTFSKIFGLAALRIGWAYGPAEIIEVLNRVRGPFNINSVALLAAATSIRDRRHVDKSVEHNQRWLNWVTEELERLGLRVTPSVANFVLVHFPDEQGKSASDADAFLAKHGFVLRAVGSYGFPNALRMSIGTEEANRGVVALLDTFMSGVANNV